jgi:hypothetical protein
VRSPEVERVLTDVRRAVTEARAGGAGLRACIWNATTAAVDAPSARAWPSEKARRTADAACLAVDPAPRAARLLYSAAQWIIRRTDRRQGNIR